MADVAVEFLLGNLKEQLVHHPHFLQGARDEMEKLEKDLRVFKAFLWDSTKRRRKDERLRELVRQIRDVVYEAEDLVDTFVTRAARRKSSNFILRAPRRPVKLLRVARDVEKVLAKIRGTYSDNSKLDLADGGPEELEAEAPIVRKDNIVGLEDEAENLIGYLKEETQQLDVISITGMPGLGKTTLAGKIFCDPAIEYEFPTRIWVYISQEFKKRDIFLAILREFTRLTDDIYRKTDVELAQLVASNLERGKFLIVMDDVWTILDWDELRIALPKSNTMGKVLITTRNLDVAQYANRDRPSHNLRFLTQEESWLLLRLEVFSKPDCPSELDAAGRLIAKNCKGLPLAILVIGGILLRKTSTSHDICATAEAWEKVSTNVSAYLNEDPQRRMERVISLSYDGLPPHSQACFLYLGMFPEDFEIPVWKLIRMWIGEGFIQQQDGYSLEETAESYLNDFIVRNLVRVEKVKSNGKVKTCRIHGMVRDFCRTEAGNEKENFLQEMKSTGGTFEHPIVDVQNYRRLAIHSEFLNFISSKPFGPLVRSLVCFSEEETDLPLENSLAIPEAFKLLRVLDVKPIQFIKIPSDLFQLIHLRYIALSFHLSILPSAFSKLLNIQTLIVDTTSRTLEVKADIWNMSQLRHLKTNVSATLPKPSRETEAGDKLQTLGTISPLNCTENFFKSARNLKKLGIRGRLSLLLDDKARSFDILRKLRTLEKLKLLNDVFPSSPLEGKLGGLPPSYKFPRKLRSLTLSATFLDWNHMSILGLLDRLEVLKLKDYAFKGRHWAVADGGFRHLEVLHIEFTDLAVWSASGHHFPRLRCLELQNCEALLEVPIGLADIPSFQLLDLYRTTSSAAASAEKIKELKQKKQADNTAKVSVFKLSIFPPDE